MISKPQLSKREYYIRIGRNIYSDDKTTLLLQRTICPLLRNWLDMKWRVLWSLQQCWPYFLNNLPSPKYYDSTLLHVWCLPCTFPKTANSYSLKAFALWKPSMILTSFVTLDTIDLEYQASSMPHSFFALQLCHASFRCAHCCVLDASLTGPLGSHSYTVPPKGQEHSKIYSGLNVGQNCNLN